MNTRLLFGLLWLTPLLSFGAPSTTTSYFLNVEALTNVTARSAVRGLTGVFTNSVTSASLTSTGYVQSPVPYPFQTQPLPTLTAASEINTSTYDAFSAMVQTPSGKLLLFYRVATAHAGNNVEGIVVKRVSTDQGRTWSGPTNVVTVPQFDALTGGAGIAFNGNVILSYTLVTTNSNTFTSLNVIRSSDDGVTWSAPTTLDVNSETVFEVYGPIIQIADSKLGLSWYGRHGSTVYSSYFVTSSDNGATWGTPVVISTVTGGAVQIGEGAPAYLGGGNILFLQRNSTATAFEQLKSSDNGATWASQGNETFDTWASPGPPMLVPFISNGKLMMACYYADRTDGKVRVVTGDAYTLFNTGVSGWNASSVTDLGSIAGPVSVGGYPVAVYPFGNEVAIVNWYNEKSASDSDMTFAVYPTAVSQFGQRISVTGVDPASSLFAADDSLVSTYSGGQNIFRFISSQNTLAASPSTLVFTRTRGTAAAPTIVGSTDQIASMLGQGFDGTTRRSAAQIRMEIDGTPSAGTDMPGKIIFATSADNTATLTDRLTIYNDGTARFGYLVHATNGVASRATDTAVAITATGWTNSFGKNATVFIEGTGVTFTVYNNAGTAVYTNVATVANVTIPLQIAGKVIVTAGTGVTGMAVPW